MKKSFIAAAVIVAACLQAQAQNNKVVSANMYLQDFAKDNNDTVALKNARAAIDEAAQNEKTKSEPKMFLYRGEVYKTIFEKKLSDASKKILISSGKMDQASVQKANTQAYAQADTTSLSIAAYSFMQVLQLEPKGGYADEARQMLLMCGGHMQNKAISDYNNQNYTEALIFFEKVLVGAKNQGVPDTSKAYVSLLQNTALTAQKAKNYGKAIKYYNEMIAHKVGGAAPYVTEFKLLTDPATGMADTNKAIDIVKQGRPLYADDFDLLISETNGYMWKHDNDKAISNLQLAIDKLIKGGITDDAHKDLLAQLYSAMGGIYDKLANPRDAQYKDLPKPANYEELFGKAEDSYKKALEQKPDFFEVNFNLGALYNNRAKYIFDQIRALPDKEQATKSKPMSDEAKGWLTKAQPYLEKAHQLKPDDATVKRVLLGLYASTGQEDKAKELTTPKQ